jgi:hypothetical protein
MKANILFAIISICCVILAQWKLAGWQVDDAAISFAYAKNLALNGQLTAQLNQAPVEGFSNPLWVFLLAAIFRLGFNYQIIPFVSAALLSTAALRIIFFRPALPETKIAFGVTGLLLMMQPSILIWSLSGLENALLLYAGTELLLCCLVLASGQSSTSNSIIAGFATSAIALSRPDGILYLALFPLVAVCSKKDTNTNRIQLVWAIGLPMTAWLLYESFRVYYFHDWLPNTYYAKGGVTRSKILEALAIGPVVFMRLSDLATSLFGWIGAFWASVATIKLVTLSWGRGNKALLISPSLMICLATTVFVLLPGDWMGEQRFATLFYPAVYLIISISILTLPLQTAFKVAITGAFLIFSGWNSLDRMREFIDNPVISMEEVEDRSRQFESWASTLGIDQPSIMTADVGGILWRNKLELVDSGMLTDRLIAKSIGESSHKSDIESLHNYIFEIRQPTFIATRAYHSWILHLDTDPRFRRDYIPLREYMDGWVLKRYGEEQLSGDYVRRDQISSEATLAIIKDQAARLNYPFCKDCPPYEKPHWNAQ